MIDTQAESRPHFSGTARWGGILLMLISVLGSSCSTARLKREALSDYHWDIQNLRMRIGQSSASPEALRDLGVLYLRTGHFEEADVMLSRALDRSKLDPKIWCYRGLAQELLDSTDAALKTYERYSYLSESSVYSRAMRGRIAWLQDAKARLALSASLVQDTTRSSTRLSASTYAVLPLQCSGAQDELSVLGMGISDLLSRDLGQIRGIEVVDPFQVRMALDVASATPARADTARLTLVGRMLRAGIMIEGTCLVGADGSIKLDLLHRDIITDQVIAVSSEGRLEDVPALEKVLFDRLIEALGIWLPSQNRTVRSSLDALIAYGQGLSHEEAGQLEQAAAFYRKAVAHAPLFSLAAVRKDAVEDKRLARGTGEEALMDLIFRLESMDATPYLLEARLQRIEGSMGTGFLPGSDNRKLPPGTVGELPAPPRPGENR